MPLLSYIIPVYNGASYLDNCLNSILALPLDSSEYEVIFVDDLSTDNSVSVIQKFQENYPQVRLICHQENKRQGGAKNTGIKNASGQYIVFLDQDDTVIPFSDGNFYRTLGTENADVYSFRFEHETLPGQWVERGIQGKEFRCTGKEFCEHHADPAVSFSPWSYWYKREYVLTQEIKFAEKVMWEDADWVARAIFKADNLHYFPKPVYRWHYNSGSISHTMNPYTLADRVFMGYRKKIFAEEIETISHDFSALLFRDAEWNIGAVKKIWKLSPPGILKFYRRIDSFDISYELKKMKIREHFFYQNIFLLYLFMAPASIAYSIFRRLK